jgi:hypothetical protein
MQSCTSFETFNDANNSTTGLEKYSYYHFLAECKIADIDGAKFYLERYPNIDIYANNFECFNDACLTGSLLLTQWFASLRPNDNLCLFSVAALKASCASGNIELVEWIYENHLKTYRDEKFGFHDSIIASMREACLYARLNVIEWFLSKFKNIAESSIFSDEELLSTILLQNINIDFTKWFCLQTNYLGTSYIYTNSLRYGLISGDIELSKWMLNTSEIYKKINFESLQTTFKDYCTSKTGIENIQLLFCMKPDMVLKSINYILINDLENLKLNKVIEYLVKLKTMDCVWNM